MVETLLRPLGHSGLELPKLTFGGNVLGWTADRDTSFKLLDACLDAGLNAIDTADCYSTWAPGHKGGESETILGDWLTARGNRDKILVLTKVGLPHDSFSGGLKRDYIIAGVERSLARLRTDHIDLYMAHRDDTATPLEETQEAFASLVRAGKVRAIGASNFSAARLQAALDVGKAHGGPRYESLQTHYNLVERPLFETDLEPLCLAQGLGVMAYFGLARGFLSGKYRSPEDAGKSPRGTQAVQYLNPKGMAVLETLDRIAAELDSNPAQIALAWLMARPSVTTAIASATSTEQLFDLIRAVQLELPQWAVAQLDRASAG